MKLSDFTRYFRKRYTLPEDWGGRKSIRHNLYYERLLFNLKEYDYSIDEMSSEDLDLDLVFNFVDRTSSIIGQQCLYERLRVPTYSPTELADLELAIAYYEAHDFSELVIHLTRTSREKDYIFPAILYEALPEPEGYEGSIRFLRLAGFALLLFGFNYPVLWIGLLPILCFNLFIHYRMKNRMGMFASVFGRLRSLFQLAKRVLPLSHFPEAKRKELLQEMKSLKRIVHQVDILSGDRFLRREATTPLWYLVEVIKFITLADVAIYVRLYRHIEQIRTSVRALYYAIGEVDVALSTLALRREVPFSCVPRFTDTESFRATEMYHPLVEDATSNTVNFKKRGVLITGSNMSGKSTFIKTVSVNAITAQSIHTCFARSYAARRYRIATSMNTVDELASGTSYYLQEVDRIGLLMRYARECTIPYLLTLDEVFRGTNTVERIAAARGVLAYLAEQDVRILAATHDMELTDLLDDYELYYFEEEVGAEGLSFDYRLKPGILQHRNALKLLRLAGYPEEVVRCAEKTAAQLDDQPTRPPHVI